MFVVVTQIIHWEDGSAGKSAYCGRMKTQVQVSNTILKSPAWPDIIITLTVWVAEATSGAPGSLRELVSKQ